MEDGFDFAEQIGVGEHDAFGVGGGSGSVEQSGDIIGGCWRGLEGSRSSGEDIGQECGPGGVGLGGVEAFGIGEHQTDAGSGDGLTGESGMFGVAE